MFASSFPSAFWCACTLYRYMAGNRLVWGKCFEFWTHRRLKERWFNMTLQNVLSCQHSSKHSEHTTTETRWVHFHFSLFNCCFVAGKRGLLPKYAHFALSYQISLLFNLWCVWILFRKLAVILLSDVLNSALRLWCSHPQLPRETSSSISFSKNIWKHLFLNDC